MSTSNLHTTCIEWNLAMRTGLNIRPCSIYKEHIKRMRVELANGKEVLSCHLVGKMEFNLGGNLSSTTFKTLPLGIYDGMLQGNNGKSKAYLVKASNSLKGVIGLQGHIP